MEAEAEAPAVGTLTAEQERALQPLTKKQRVFLFAYLKSNNAVGAAREAGYAFPDPQGAQNLYKPRIQSALTVFRAPAELRQREEETRAIVSRDRTLERLERLAEAYACPHDPKRAMVAVKAQALIARIQGWEQKGDTGGATVVVQVSTGIDRQAGVTIDHGPLPDTAEPVTIEHSPVVADDNQIEPPPVVAEPPVDPLS